MPPETASVSVLEPACVAIVLDAYMSMYGICGNTPWSRAYTVSVAALTVYDMVKGADPTLIIEGIRLVEKTGGKTDLKLR